VAVPSSGRSASPPSPGAASLDAPGEFTPPSEVDVDEPPPSADTGAQYVHTVSEFVLEHAAPVIKRPIEIRTRLLRLFMSLSRHSSRAVQANASREYPLSQYS
jgi:hypothetical protein